MLPAILYQLHPKLISNAHQLLHNLQQPNGSKLPPSSPPTRWLIRRRLVPGFPAILYLIPPATPAIWWLIMGHLRELRLPQLAYKWVPHLPYKVCHFAATFATKSVAFRRQNRQPYGSNCCASASAYNQPTAIKQSLLNESNQRVLCGFATPLIQFSNANTPLSFPFLNMSHLRKQVCFARFAVTPIQRTKLVPNLPNASLNRTLFSSIIPASLRS